MECQERESGSQCAITASPCRTYGVDVSLSRVNVETTEVSARLHEAIVRRCKAGGEYLKSMAIHTMSREGSIESMSIEEIVVPGDETADTVRAR
jgi:hypothetical protein